MALLGVNIDHVATLRQARKIDYPDPVEAAVACEKAGADSIVCHLREDRRHIQDEDLRRLKKRVAIKLNLEMAMSKEIVGIALGVKPDQVTLVPEKREELTTEGGLDVVTHRKRVADVIGRMREAGIETSLFIDPERRQIKTAKEIGACMIEIHTGRYANVMRRPQKRREYNALRDTALYASDLGLQVFAGHGLHYRNVLPLTKIGVIEEYNIGHAIVSRAVFVGLGAAVREMKRLIG